MAIKTPAARSTSRRDFFYNVGLASAGIALGGVLSACRSDTFARAEGENIDPDVLNFALNLEYLEAEYYLLGLTGMGLDPARGSGGRTVTGGSKVPFPSGSLIEQYAMEIAIDERDHVRFLRQALGDAAVPIPDIDFQVAFNAIGFDPVANELNFLLGGFLFEDVGVTAYNGGAPLITNKDFLSAAASILAVEAYHSGSVRTTLFALGQDDPSLIESANALSDARNSLNPGTNKDQGITDDGTPEGNANIVPADEFALAFSRSVEEVLNIVYLNPNTEPGGFFPNGLNGTFA